MVRHDPDIQVEKALIDLSEMKTHIYKGTEGGNSREQLTYLQQQSALGPQQAFANNQVATSEVGGVTRSEFGNQNRFQNTGFSHIEKANQTLQGKT